MAVFQGAGVAIVTPFKANGEVNYDKFAELLEFQIGNGTDAIIVCGTTGESSTLTHEEHLEVIRFCVEKVAGRIPVVAGTGSNCTETAVRCRRQRRQTDRRHGKAGRGQRLLPQQQALCGRDLCRHRGGQNL